jgi:hypothetical protein
MWWLGLASHLAPTEYQVREASKKTGTHNANWWQLADVTKLVNSQTGRGIGLSRKCFPENAAFEYALISKFVKPEWPRPKKRLYNLVLFTFG